MHISLEKSLALFTLGIISLVVGLIPYFIIRFRKEISLQQESTVYKIVLTILSCFGGGILLATAALHLLPEVREKVENVPKISQIFGSEFPAAEMFTLCGFLLIYLIEEIANLILMNKKNDILYDGHYCHGSANTSSIVNRYDNLSRDCQNGRPLCLIDRDNLSQSSECIENNSNFISSARSVIALIALSFHAIMEGVAIGIQNESNVWMMFGAVASHKFVISFCMGMELMNAHAHFWTYLSSIGLFSVVSPVGILIGAAISSATTSADSLGVVIIEGFVCGTLLYVVFFEILNRERERKSCTIRNIPLIGIVQFFSLAIGSVAMGCLIAFIPDADASQHGGNSSNETTENYEKFIL